MTDMLLGVVQGNQTLFAGTHYAIAWQVTVNLQGVRFQQELSWGGGNAASVGLELAGAVDVVPVRGGYLHRALFSLRNQSNARALRVGVAGASNRAGAPVAVLPEHVTIYAVNEAEYQRRTGLGAPLWAAVSAGEAAIEGAGRAAAELRRQARDAAAAFAGIGQTLARIAIWGPILAAGGAAVVLGVVFWPQIKAAVR